MSDEQVFRVISDGVPGTGMPAFHALSERERRRIVQHLRTLQGRGKPSAVAGNAEQGKTIFFGKAECSGCHMIAGQGGFLGSDLTAYARTKSAQEVREAIVNPTVDPDPRTKAVTATTRDGRTVTGLLRNHDNFSVQIQTKDGSFHFLQRSDLAHLEYGPESIMPSDYAQQLTSKELDDVVKYLMHVASAQKSGAVVPEED